MNLRDAFAGMKEAQELEQPGTQAPKHPGTQAPKRLSTQVPKHSGTQAPIALQGTAKSKHPEYEAVKIFLRKRTRNDAWRKWKDAEGGDFSDLVQMLLEKYLKDRD